MRSIAFSEILYTEWNIYIPHFSWADQVKYGFNILDYSEIYTYDNFMPKPSF